MKRLPVLLFAFLLIAAVETVVRAQATVKQQPMNVAILLFDGVQTIDYTGPYEVLSGAPPRTGSVRPFNVYTVAERPVNIKTAAGMIVVPSYSFANAPRTDILVVPGGGALGGSVGVNAQVTNPIVIKWVQDTAKDAKLVMSVCNGAFIIAEAGLLDGLEATTTAGAYISALRKNYPKIKVVNDKRFVDNGRIVTTAGLSAGIDGSIHLVEKLLGHTVAKLAALGLEYNWQPESKYARASFADMNMPQSIYRAFYVDETELLEFDGGIDKWEETYRTPSVLSASEMLQRIKDKFAGESTWTRTDLRVGDPSAETSSWKFTDEKRQTWNFTASIQRAPEKDQLLVSLKIFRAETTAEKRQ